MPRMHEWQREAHEAVRREVWSPRGPNQIVEVGTFNTLNCFWHTRSLRNYGVLVFSPTGRNIDESVFPFEASGTPDGTHSEKREQILLQ
jgi:hypothetical protein